MPIKTMLTHVQLTAQPQLPLPVMTWTIYANPETDPGCVLARKYCVDASGDYDSHEVIRVQYHHDEPEPPPIAEQYHQMIKLARATILTFSPGMIRTERATKDHPSIVEHWI